MNYDLRVSFAKYLLIQIALFTEVHPFLQQYYHIFYLPDKIMWYDIFNRKHGQYSLDYK